MRRLAVALAGLALTAAACGGAGGEDAPAPLPQPPALEDGTPAPGLSTGVAPGADVALTAPLPIEGDGALDIVRAEVVLAGDGLAAGVVQLLPATDEIGLVNGAGVVQDSLGELAGTTLTERRNGLGVTLRAVRRGVYLVRGIDVGYRRDGEDGEQIVAPAVCLVVTDRARTSCDGDPAELLDGTQIAAVGVELLSDAGATLADMEDAGLGQQVVVEGGRRGTAQIGLALANLTDAPLEVGGLAPIRLDADGRSLKGTVVGASAFTIAPNGSRLVRLRLRATGCGGGSSAVSLTELPARVDGEAAQIPLGVPVTLGPGDC